MTYQQAKKLHNEDEVTFKLTGRVMRVIEIRICEDTHDVSVLCDDGHWYHHRSLR